MTKSIFLLVFTVMLFSCQKVIDVNPDTGEEKVIIQAYLYKDSLAYVVITKSTDYLTNTPPPSISNAVVTLSNAQLGSEILEWNAVSQRFESISMRGRLHNTPYIIKVDLEGKSYSATSTFVYLDPLDRVAVSEGWYFGVEGYYMELYGTIPTNVDKYFLFKGYSNDSLLNGPHGIYYADNTKISGVVDGYQLGFNCVPGQTAKVEIYSLTRSAYNFYAAANLQLNNDGGFFSTPPANVPSMFNNGAIGLFQCSAVQVLTTFVQVQP